ncbi:MAG: SH3 domain-containing protein, partial [Phyllobacteriaceae bacterium]|nr:SH3 domain-containing protein [Phyllobacteriaceae bacterium]
SRGPGSGGPGAEQPGGGFPPPPGSGGGSDGGGQSTGDLYRVVGIGAGETLNVRAGPDASFEVVAELAAGTRRLELGACRRAGTTQWCQIATTRGIPVRGWVNARFLSEDR